MAIVWSVKYFDTYLYGRKFVIQTDHKPLIWLNSLQFPNMKLQRWKMQLNEYDFDINYIKGKDNYVADGLSRLFCNDSPYSTTNRKEKESEQNDLRNYELNNNERISGNDNDIMSTDATIHSAVEDDLHYIHITENAINIYKNQIFLEIGVNEKSFTKIINKKCKNFIHVTEDSDLLGIMKRFIVDKGLMCIYCEDTQLFLKFQNIYVKYFANNSNLKLLRSCTKLIDITDKNEMLTIIKKEHLKNNHRGISEVFYELKLLYYYPNMLKLIHKYINNCDICNIGKYDRHPPNLAFEHTESPAGFNDVHMDIWHPCRNVMYLTMIDKFSKHATIHKLGDRTWVSILKAIKERLIYLGKMKKLVSDGETCIIHNAVEQFLKDIGITFHQTTACNKTGNSDIERLHGTLNEHLRLIDADRDKTDLDNIDDKIFKVILIYNVTIHSTTKLRPIDFINKNLNKDEIEELANKFQAQKTERIEKLNKNKDNQYSLCENIVVNRDISKCKPKYKKFNEFKLDGNYITDTSNRRFTKCCKKQRKRKFKHQRNA